MIRPFFLPTLALAALLSAGCDDASRTTATEPQLETIRGGEQRLITMTDACDPQTFDAGSVPAPAPGTVAFSSRNSSSCWGNIRRSVPGTSPRLR